MQRNGTVWSDIAGAPIQAHGGWILPVREAAGVTYYWYGEDKSGETRDRRMDAIGIRCYRSRDLVRWEDLGLVFRADPVSDLDVLRPSGVMERPRILRCPATGRFVMWLHSDDASYRYAGVTVAAADAPAGPFRRVRTMIPNGQDSRDLTLFANDDGTAYLIHSSEWNRTLHIARLTGDYLDVDGMWTRAFPEQSREAPCIMRLPADPDPAMRFTGGYAMVTSGCTGWSANPALYGTARRIEGPWKLVDNPCEGPAARTTFNGQCTCIFEAGEGAARHPYVLIDHWHPDDLGASGYSILPIRVVRGHHPALEIRWLGTWAGVLPV